MNTAKSGPGRGCFGRVAEHYNGPPTMRSDLDVKPVDVSHPGAERLDHRLFGSDPRREAIDPTCTVPALIVCQEAGKELLAANGDRTLEPLDINDIDADTGDRRLCRRLSPHNALNDPSHFGRACRMSAEARHLP